MPSDDLLLYFQRDLHVVDHWRSTAATIRKPLKPGCEIWIATARRFLTLFSETYAAGLQGRDREREVRRWLVRWRVFFMACADYGAMRQASEWMVSHYLFSRLRSERVPNGGLIGKRLQPRRSDHPGTGL